MSLRDGPLAYLERALSGDFKEITSVGGGVMFGDLIIRSNGDVALAFCLYGTLVVLETVVSLLPVDVGGCTFYCWLLKCEF